ncbi:ABC transporter substrate-binding protein [Rhodococcus sp. NPDC003318]|uniref:ABC transporter substrate-binding protein n=1 Tax=Rhodococcus sp. NPDC003318 TaxID=3364503 RepID=UPI0036BADC23
MRSRRALGALATVVVAGLTLAGCSSSDDSGEATGDPKPGGTLVSAFVGETQSLDPAICGLVAYQRCSPIFGTLLRYDAENDKIVPYLAQSFESPDGANWTLKLRDGVKFSDGTPFDADAVVFNWNRIKDPATLSGALAATRGVTWAVVDPTTVSVTLDKPNYQFPWQLVRGLGAIGSPTAIQAAGAEVGTKPVGAGPFTVQSWVRNSELKLVKNPTYFEQGLPYLDAMTIKIVTSEEQKFNALLSGEASVANASNEVDASKMESNGFRVDEANVYGGSGVIFNYKNASLQDEGLRSAILHAIDNDQFVDALDKVAEPAEAFLRPGDTSAAYPNFDLSESQKQFDDYLKRTGKTSETVTITSYAGFPVMEQSSQLLQAQLQKIKGLTATIVPLEAPVLLSKQRQGDYQLLLTTFQSPTRDLMFDLFHTNGAQNTTGYSNPAVDAALETTRSSTDPAEVNKAYESANIQIAKDAPMRTWNYIDSYLVSDKDVQGVQIVPTGAGAAWDWEKVWLN